MIISHPDINDITVLEQIWKSVFGDTDEYIELFFSKVQTPENTLIVKESDKIISMVFYPEYNCKISGTETKCGYICGAATLPEYRGKGIMGKLLMAAIEDMKKKNYGAAVLIPANETLFGYYEKFGFIKNFCYRKIENMNFSGGNSRLISIAENVEDFWNIYIKATKNIPDMVLQSRESYKTVMEEYEGRVYLFDNKCLLFVNKDIVDEIFTTDKTAVFNAVSSLEAYTGEKINSVRCYTGYLENSGEIVYNGMFFNLQNFVPSYNSYLKMVLE